MFYIFSSPHSFVGLKVEFFLFLTCSSNCSSFDMRLLFKFWKWNVASLFWNLPSSGVTSSSSFIVVCQLTSTGPNTFIQKSFFQHEHCCLIKQSCKVLKVSSFSLRGVCQVCQRSPENIPHFMMFGFRNGSPCTVKLLPRGFQTKKLSSRLSVCLHWMTGPVVSLKVCYCLSWI